MGLSISRGHCGTEAGAGGEPVGSWEAFRPEYMDVNANKAFLRASFEAIRGTIHEPVGYFRREGSALLFLGRGRKASINPFHRSSWYRVRRQLVD